MPTWACTSMVTLFGLTSRPGRPCWRAAVGSYLFQWATCFLPSPILPEFAKRISGDPDARALQHPWVLESCCATSGTTTSIRRPAAVNHECRAGDQGRGVGGQEQDGTRHVLDRAEAAELDLGDHLGLEGGVLEERLRQRRVEEGGAHGVDPDSGGRQ